MKKYFLLILIPAVISLLFISCNPDGPGIFYRISIEQPLSESDLAERSVYKVVELSGVAYVLSGGVVFKESGSDWKEISSPSGMLQAVSLEALDSTSMLYCVYTDKDNDNSTLYSGTGSSWTKSALFEDSENSLTVVASSQTLFIVERIAEDQYRIYNLAKTDDIDVENFVRGAAHDGGTIDYILASPEINDFSIPEIVTYDGTTFSTFSVTDGDLKDALDDDETALGNIYSDGTNIYISTKTGYVMSGLNTEVATGINNINDDDLDNEELGSMNKVYINGSDYLLIGSDGGYYEMLLPSGTIKTPTSSTTGDTDYSSVDLYEEIVFSIKADGTDGFFIGTSNGLWHSSTSSDLDLK